MSKFSNWDIITVSYNSEDVLARNWNWYKNYDGQIRWTLVDNNSTDDSVGVARKLGAHVIEMKSNVGFSKANNVGFNYSSSKYVLFANPDLFVNLSDLSTLENNLQRYPGICSPQLLNPDGSFQQNGRGLPFLSAKLAHRNFPFLQNTRKARQYLPEIRDHGLYSVEWFMGAAVAAKREDFVAIGKWNEEYFIYYEDHELGIRAKNCGYNVMIDASIRWRHEWARETKSLNRNAWKNELQSAFKFYKSHLKLLR
jgi:N-acetylglucosaminyl-diphospho-decaprenol L-rhamnosyltransferase